MDCWSSSIPKAPQFIFANEIKRKGGPGVDNGDMIGAVAGQLSYDNNGIAREYIILESGNKRIQSFYAEYTDSFRSDEILLQHFYMKTLVKKNLIRL